MIARLFFSIVLMVLLLGCGKTPQVRKPAPDFALKDMHGETVRLSDYRGKVVLLDFWATWCGPCKVEEPWFVEFEKMYKDQGFAVVGVSIDEEGWDVVKPYVEQKKINFRVLLQSGKMDPLYEGIEAWPTTFLIDRVGKIVFTQVGVGSKQKFEETIQQLLKESLSQPK